jgi:tight adherence protein C
MMGEKVMITAQHLPAIFSITAFFCFLLLFCGVSQYLKFRSKKREIKDKIQQTRDGFDISDIDNPTPQSSKSNTKGIINFWGSIGKRVISENAMQHSGLRLKLLKAGVRRLNGPAIFWGAKIFLSLLLSLTFFLTRISLLKVFDPLQSVFICLCCFAIGYYLPDLWLRMRCDHRKARILNGFPDALDLLVICVEAGMGLDAAINRVAEETKLTNSVLSDELKLLNLEIRAGKSRQEAMRNLSLRVDLEEINSFVTLLIQTDKFGTSLAQTLRIYSDSFRTKRFQKAEEIAARLPVKLMFPCLLFIFPTIFIVILGPAAIQIYKTLLTQY